MALTASISDTFDIYITSSAAETRDIANVGRAFRIIGVSSFNDGGTGTLTVQSPAATDVVPAAATLSGAWKDMVITQANAEVAVADAIRIITGAGGWGANSRIILHCVATGGGFPLGVS